MNNKINEKIIIYKRTNGSIIQFRNWSLQFYFYGFRRILQFLFDIGLSIVTMLLFSLIFNINFWLSNFISLLFFYFCNGWFLYLFKNKTLGMLIAGLCIVNYDGSYVLKKSKWLRILVSGVYVIPIIGWFLALISFLTSFLTKGISFVDLVTKTQIFLKYKAKLYEKIIK